MTKTILIMAFAMILIMGFANAELTITQDVIIDNATSTVNQHTDVFLDDVGNTYILQKYVPIRIAYQTKADLPRDLEGKGYVDWCNFSMVHLQNIYSSDGTNLLLNATYVYDDIIFVNQSATSGTKDLRLLSRDSVGIDFTCHYTNVSTLFYQQQLTGEVTVITPALSCKGCSDSSFESLTDTNEQLEDRTNQETMIIDNIQNLVDKNYLVWNILSWFVKIAFIFIAVSLVFVAMYYLYEFFTGVANKIK